MSVGLLSFSAPPAVSTALVVNLVYETSALGAPQSFRDAMQNAANLLSAAFTKTAITVNIQVGYNDWDNNVITGLGTSSAGDDLNGGFVSYSTIKSLLASLAQTSTLTTFAASLPAGSSLDGHSSFFMPSAIQKALGLLSPTNAGIDGAIGVGSSIGAGNLVGVALHEMTHAMGRSNSSGVEMFSLGRFTSAGTRLYTSSSTAASAYFSLDNGATKLADYGVSSDPSDFLNGGVQGSTDALNEFYNGSTLQTLTTVDIQQMNALGIQ